MFSPMDDCIIITVVKNILGVNMYSEAEVRLSDYRKFGDRIITEAIQRAERDIEERAKRKPNLP